MGADTASEMKMRRLEHVQQKCAAVLRKSMLKNKDLKNFRDSKKSARALGVWALILAATTALVACDGRPLLYQVAPSETDIATLVAFQKIDAAGKGQLTRAEVDDYLKRRFAKLDVNHDKLLDDTELAPFLPFLNMKSASEMIFRLDFSSDGKLSEAEFLRLSNYLFARDYNKDGVLTLVEVKTPPSDTYIEASTNKPGLSVGTPASQGNRP